jgi:hypothetical protein
VFLFPLFSSLVEVFMLLVSSLLVSLSSVDFLWVNHQFSFWLRRTFSNRSPNFDWQIVLVLLIWRIY